MTIKELLKLPPEGLEKMSDAELKNYFEPYLKFIIPVEKKEERELKLGDSPVKRYHGPSLAKQTLNMAEKLAKQLGVKI